MYKTGIFSREENDFIINNYSKLTQKEIAKILNRKETSIKDRIGKLNLKKVQKNIWTLEEENLLKEIWHKENNYLQYFPNRTKSSILYKAHHLGLKRNGRGNYNINHDFFKELNNLSTYIIGLIAADGNIYTKRYRLTITLHKNDKYLLEDIRKNMESERPISDRKTNASDLVITSREIINDFKKIGLSDAKSLTLEKLNIPNEYMSHFVRGYIDGDGTLGYYLDKRRNRKYFTIGILGTYNFLNWLNEYFNKNLNIGLKNITSTNSSIKRLKYSGKEAYNLARWMYQDKNLYLKRKYDTFNKYEVDISKKQ